MTMLAIITVHEIIRLCFLALLLALIWFGLTKFGLQDPWRLVAGAILALVFLWYLASVLGIA